MKEDFAREHLAIVLSFFPRVESQINVLVTLEVAMVGYLVSNLPAPNAWANVTAFLIALLSLTGAAFTTSFIVLYLASFPRLKGGDNSMVYFRTIAKRSEAAFSDAYAHLKPADLVPQLSEQIWRNSQILTLKYDRLKYAFVSFAVAGVSWATTLLMLPN